MKRQFLGLATGIFTFIAAVALSTLVSYQIGRLEAHLDFMHGRRQLNVCWEGTDSREAAREFKSILLSKYAVETVLPSSCSSAMSPLFSKGGVSFERTLGYNYQEAKELERIYGRDVIKETGNKVYLYCQITFRAEYAASGFDR